MDYKIANTDNVLYNAGFSENVIKAYKRIRTVYNRAHARTTTVNKMTGRTDNLGFIEAYLPHYFENFVVDIYDNNGKKIEELTNSYPTEYDAIIAANETIKSYPNHKATVRPFVRTAPTEMFKDRISDMIEQPASAKQILNLQKDACLS